YVSVTPFNVFAVCLPQASYVNVVVPFGPVMLVSSFALLYAKVVLFARSSARMRMLSNSKGLVVDSALTIPTVTLSELSSEVVTLKINVSSSPSVLRHTLTLLPSHSARIVYHWP